MLAGGDGPSGGSFFERIVSHEQNRSVNIAVDSVDRRSSDDECKNQTSLHDGDDSPAAEDLRAVRALPVNSGGRMEPQANPRTDARRRRSRQQSALTAHKGQFYAGTYDDTNQEDQTAL